MPSNYQSFGSKFGWNLSALVVYLNVALRLNRGEIREYLGRVLGLLMSHSSLLKMKRDFAAYYLPTVKQIFKDIKKGQLLQVDETNAKADGKASYVWVFSTLLEVVYLFAETRKGDILQANLKKFQGVLVSDFYSAYDSIPYQQQKCLIHLIRDLNDDLFKNQLNDEFKGFVVEFAMLMKKIVGTIDQRGLRTRYLSKHKKDATQFFRKIGTTEYTTEIAQQYQKRFLKNQNRLFVFLDHDNVPWNNNYAENAIKTFAELRHKFSRKRLNKEGLKEYLVLLSVQHTCKLRGIDFLRFLLSGRKSLPPGTKI